MTKSTEQQQIELLEQIKRLLILNLSHQGIQGKKIAEAMGVDAAVVSRILASKRSK